MMILIVSGNSNLGSAVARRLRAQGRPVRGLVRSPEKGEALQRLGADIVIGDLRDPAYRGQIIEVGGTENPTNAEIVRLYEVRLGRPVKVSHLPLPVLKVMYRLIRPFHPGLSQIMPSAIIGDTTDQTFDPTEMLAQFPMELVTIEAFVRESAGKWETAQATVSANGLAL